VTKDISRADEPPGEPTPEASQHLAAQQEATSGHVSLEAIGGSSYRQLIDAQLTEERATKASLEERGFSVVTTSGGLATLLFGLAALAKNVEKVALNGWEGFFLIAAVVCFVLAAAAGLWTTRPRGYSEAAVKRLQARVEAPLWFNRDVLEAYRKDAQLNVDILEDARKANAKKANTLQAAVVLDVLAIVCVAFAVAIVILT
jgi:hypothetical protein